MVFCYKIITETPRRSGCMSPRKKSPMNNIIKNGNILSVYSCTLVLDREYNVISVPNVVGSKLIKTMEIHISWLSKVNLMWNLVFYKSHHHHQSIA